MIGIDFSDPHFDLFQAAYDALTRGDLDELRFLSAGSTGGPLSLKVPGWLRVKPAAPPSVVAAAERLLSAHLPPPCLTRLALEDACSIMPALGRVLHLPDPFETISCEVTSWDTRCAVHRIRVRRLEDGRHCVDLDGEIAVLRRFPEVVRWVCDRRP